MKYPQISEDILPLAKFKTDASKVLRHLKDSNRPIIITVNGKPAAVLITPEDFDRTIEKQRFLTAIQQGLADSEDGRVISDEQMTQTLQKEFGPLEE